ncbi:molybdate ABC transporter substrate-binding protein [Caminibacter profundus]
MIRKVLILGVFLKLLIASDVFVASAANVSYAMPKIVKEFKKENPGINVKVVLASSGKLTAQIMHGAPYDVFLSANMKYPNTLYKKGFGKLAPKVYAKGAIVFFSTKIKNPNFNSLIKAREIVIANPSLAPYGKAAVEAFKAKGVFKKIKDKLVYAESVTAVIPYTIHSADIGVVAKSSLYSPKIKNIGKFYSSDINEKLYTPINQGIILLSNKKEARKFYDFMLSNKAKKILKEYGYNTN